jgi:sugar O-acyltransferase (sialic acid O-acetyltransferase NeuD family)
LCLHAVVPSLLTAGNTMNQISAVKKNREKKILIGLYGAGGFAREVMPIVAEQLERDKHLHVGSDFESCFVDRNPQLSRLNSCPLISEDDFLQSECDERLFNVAIADSRIREKIAHACLAQGMKSLSIRASQSVIYDENQIGEGSIICAYSVITSNAKIGKFFHSHIYSYVTHDCVIGDYVTFAPNVHCNGNVHIGDHAFIGAGAIIKQGTLFRPLVIGEGAIVGMGAVVTKDVAPYTTVVGNPAKVLP